jgi:gluconolactonase
VKGATRFTVVVALVAAAGGAIDATPAAVRGRLDGRPDAVIDLDTNEGLRLVGGEWRYRQATLIDAEFTTVGPDLRPGTMKVMTADLEPKAGASDFDTSAWEVLEPASLKVRRATGRSSFAWYRLAFTVPDRIGAFDPTGSTMVFEVVVDDYAEVWVDGQLPRGLGQAGGSLIAGFNAPNRVVISRAVRPGQRFELSLFTANGPLSDPPPNYIWIRSATLDFYKPASAAEGVPADVLRVDPAIDRIVPRDARIETVADDFSFIEGPVWTQDNALLFSDPNDNRIYRWSPDLGVSVFRTKSGYSGFDIGEYGQPGSNGLTLDADGLLTIAEHGNRRVTRLERTGAITVLADRFNGRRLNSPNDLVYKSDGSLYFTDPFFGLPKFENDPRREQPHAGIYRVAQGHVQLLSTELKGPNGIAFSPDERYLYVTNWDEKKKIIMRWDVTPDGTLANGRTFFDMTSAPGEEALDGLKVDAEGHLYASGPGGLWIIAPDGRHLGTIRAPQLPANFAWGNADGHTLYLTARSGLYRIRLNVPGVRPGILKSTH